MRAGPVIPFAAAPAPARRTALPRARGPVSGILLEVLHCAPGMPVELPLLDPTPELLADDDVQLALYLCYELHYAELEGVDDRWEWDPGLLAFRMVLERAFEAALCDAVPPPQSAMPAEVVATALHALVAAGDDPPLSRFVETHATLAQLRELMIHRCAHRPPFAPAMAALGLDPRYGAYVERLPGVTFATVNLMSLCGLHRRLRGATVGHLAALEMTSAPAAGHEHVGAWDLVGGLAAAEPALAGDILWGAAALLDLDARWGRHLLAAWERGESSLLTPRSGPAG